MNRAVIIMFLIGLVVYGAVAGPRLRTRSADPHFLVLANAWLHGRLNVAPWPPGADDPAIVERVRLDDGTVVRGRRLMTRPVFHVAGGTEIPVSRITASEGVEYHVGFPPFPAVVFLPIVFVFGSAANDVIATVVLAALIPALMLVVLRRLRDHGLSSRPASDDVWLAVLLAFGTVVFFSAVQGRVWYTAHIIGVDLALLYVWASIDAARPVTAGLCLGFAFTTRAPMLFMFPLFASEMWRTGRLRAWKRWLAFIVPIVCIGLLAAWHNYARFGEATEFGHRYLAVRQELDIERHGLFGLRYLPRNLAASLLLLPTFSSNRPYVAISGHGLALWFTTPPLLLLLGSRQKGAFARGLWMSAGAVAVWTLLYQNTGWVQFGYRFALDYIVFLLLLIAVTDRPLTRLARASIVVAVAINLFGAVTFDRFPQFYLTDATAYRALVHD